MKQFFDFDLGAILKNCHWEIGTIDGKPVREAHVTLNPIQMEMFDELNVCQYADGSMTLDFFSDKYAPTKPLMDFMAYCTKLWGNDKYGNGLPSEKDVITLRNGKFNRFWDTVSIVQYQKPSHFSLTILMRIYVDNKDTSAFAINLMNNSNLGSYNPDSNAVTPCNTSMDEMPNQPSQATPPPITNTEENIGTIPTLSAWNIICIIFGIVMFPIGTAIVFGYGLMRFSKGTVKITWTETAPQYQQYGRYRTKTQRTITIKRTKVVKADQLAKSVYRKQGIIIMAASIIFAIIMVISYILR